jgi:hypothetical protein
MAEQKKVIITAEDCNNGIRRSSISCPTALALKRDYNKTVSVGLFTGDIYSDIDLVFLHLHFDGKLSEEINKFDTTGQFTPGEYTYYSEEMDA